MIPGLFQILSAAPAVTALLGSNPVRVYPFGQAPQLSEYPYATYTVFSGDPQNMMDKTPDFDNLGTTVDVWAKTAASAQAVAVAVRDAVEPHAHMVRIGNMTRDPETNSYRVSLDFDFFTER